MAVTFKRAPQEVDELGNKIDTFVPSKYPGMTYEQGIEETILWLLDEHAEPPAVK